ncbi:uncharacterized protein LOC125537490 [Triticum urartu]|uniref:uncharacterized protein LOC125537490 n=1 Tax=Triticum urartu TaxID=4572 RepID=UPI002043C6B9|nr:uncharacterized protein LOC125537490 [Triticum urartu]
MHTTTTKYQFSSVQFVMLLHLPVIDEPLGRRFLLSGPDPTSAAKARHLHLPAKDHHLPDDVPTPTRPASPGVPAATPQPPVQPWILAIHHAIRSMIVPGKKAEPLGA